MTTAKASGRRPVTLREIQARGRIRGTAGVLGPAFVASVAYVDPGNFATNFAGGAEQGYELVWVIVMANLMAIGVQYLTSKAGLATGQSLPELCRDRFSRRVNVLLWLQAEVVAMATDLAEFVGAAVGLNLVFGVPLFPAALITALVAFVILDLERRGYRRFELAITHDRRIMSDMVNRRLTSTLMLLTTVIVTGLNLYPLYGAAAACSDEGAWPEAC